MEWDSKNRTLSVATTRSWKFMANLAYLVWQAAVVFFCGFRFNSALRTSAQQQDLLQIVIELFVLVCVITMFALNLTFFISRNEMANFFSLIVTPGVDKEAKQSRVQIIDLAQKCFVCVAPATAVTFTVGEYLIMVLGNDMDKSTSVWTVLGFLLISTSHILSTYVAASIFGLMQIYVIIFFTTVTDTLARYTKDLNVNVLTAALADYRSLALICNRFNEACGRLILPGQKFMITITGPLFAYIAIRGEIGFYLQWTFLFTGLYIMTVAVLGVHALSTLWATSTNFLVRIERASSDAEERKLLLATVKSSQPLRISLGGIYYLERDAKLTFIDFLAKALVNMLLFVG
jgi:hypothetical protein